MLWARMLAYITGTVDQELLLRNEYLAAENRILRAQIQGRLLLSDAEKATLAEIARRLGRRALEGLAATAKPDTLLAWYQKLIAHKFDGSKCRKTRGRPPVDEETERLVARMARENPSWGYDRIVGAMGNLGHQLSDQTVGNILRRHDIPPAAQRKQTTSWKDFIRTHMAVLVATDVFTVEVLTLRGLMTYYVLFFIHLESRRICLAGVTRHPDAEWMEQMAPHSDDGRYRFSEPPQVCIARSRPQVLRRVSRSDPGGRHRTDCIAGQKSESERLCGTLGQVGEGRMFIEADPVGRGFSAPSAKPLRGTLSWGTKSPRQRQPPAVPLADSSSPWKTRTGALSGTARWPAEIL